MGRPQSATPFVAAEGVVKVYDTGAVPVQALADVDLTAEAGEVVAIMGPSGCGKATLLNCLSGLDTFDEGDVRIEGVSLASVSDRERTAYRGRRMGFVFQFYNLLPVLSAVENVELPLLICPAEALDTSDPSHEEAHHDRDRQPGERTPAHHAPRRRPPAPPCPLR